MWTPRRIALFARFPRFAPRSHADDTARASQTLLTDEKDRRVELANATAEFPTLAPALAELQEVLVADFDECDQRALLEQNRHRRQQVLLIIGGLMATAFGLLQAALVGSVWPGIALAVTAATTTAVASVGRQSAALDSYLTNRLRAEQLRSAYFTYLLVDPDDTEVDHHVALNQQVVSIRYDEHGAAP